MCNNRLRVTTSQRAGAPARAARTARALRINADKPECERGGNVAVRHLNRRLCKDRALACNGNTGVAEIARNEGRFVVALKTCRALSASTAYDRCAFGEPKLQRTLYSTHSFV